MTCTLLETRLKNESELCRKTGNEKGPFKEIARRTPFLRKIYNIFLFRNLKLPNDCESECVSHQNIQIQVKKQKSAVGQTRPHDTPHHST